MKKSDFQKNALLIKHIKEAPAHSDVTHSQHEGTRRFGHQLRQAAKDVVTAMLGMFTGEFIKWKKEGLGETRKVAVLATAGVAWLV